MRALPKSIDQTQEMLGRTGYLCGRGLATVVMMVIMPMTTITTTVSW